MPSFARRLLALTLLGLAPLAAAAPLSAEVIEAKEGHFVTRDEAVVEADLKETWLALIAPAKWWNPAHTFTGDSDNLTLTPQAGGCFCERVPEISEPGRFTLEGSVEHLRVVNAMPEQALRLVGALGPLQSEPVDGVLTIALTKVAKGTRIVWEYNVGGPMRYEVEVIAKAVDGVMSQQLFGLAKLLGRVEVPASAAEPEAPEAPEAKTEAAPETGKGEGDPAAKPAPKPEPKPEPKPRESVEDAFSDLEDNG